jgi:hypothetical protein
LGDKIKKNGIGEACSMRGKERAYAGFWWGNLKSKVHLGDPSVNGRIVLRRIFRMWDVGEWCRLSWLRINTGGRHL